MINPAQTTRKAVTMALAFAALGLLATAAAAVNPSVKRKCADDYFSFCSKHAVGSKSLKQCMRRNGPKLSKRCVNALIKAGMVPKTKVARKSSRRRR